MDELGGMCLFKKKKKTGAHGTIRITLYGFNNTLVESTLVISTSLISNNRLSRSEILVPVLTLKSKNR